MRTKHMALRLFAYIATAIALSLTPLIANADGPAPKKGQAGFEIRWMKNMIDHHHMAVMMAELCATRAVHPELIAMCQNMAATQALEIEQMQMWLVDWYGIQYEPQMTSTGERIIAGLAELQGEEFEIEFMETMVQHHLRAIKQATSALRRAYHAELKALADQMIQMQATEILGMREWLCGWYNRC